MSLPNVLRDRVTVQEKTSEIGAMGETVTWKPVQKMFARVVALSTRARLDFQQTQTEATHTVFYRIGTTLALDANRFLWKSKTLELVKPPQELDGLMSIVVKEA